MEFNRAFSRRKREKELLERELALARLEIEAMRRGVYTDPVAEDEGRQQPMHSIAATNNNVLTDQPRANITAIADLLSNFSGQSSDYEIWEEQVKLLKVTYKLEDDTAKILVGMRLKGKSLEWLHSKPEYIAMTFDRLLDELRAMFYRRQSKVAIRKKFEERMWKKDETFHEYFYEKIIMGNRVPIDDSEILEYVIEGIPDEALQNQARIQRFTTIDGLLEAFEKVTLRDRAGTPGSSTSNKQNGLKKVEEDSTWWSKLLTVLGELIGTALLVFLGCTACVGTLAGKPPPIQIALASGLAVMIAVQCVGHISGAHVNPAITVATVILGNKSLPMAGFYIIAQCLGSVIGYGLLKIITPHDLLYDGDDSRTTESFCTTKINPNLNAAHGVVAEALATGIFVFFACGVWDSRNAKNTDSIAIKFGLCIAMLAFAFAPYTTCSLNPARTFGPAVWNNYWENHWVYWLGPIGGAIISALIYRYLFTPKTKNQYGVTHDMETFNGIET